MLIQLEHLETLQDNPQAQAGLDSLIERIEQNIRDTDRCTRSREDRLWLLLPSTGRQGVEILSQRLSSLMQLLEGENSMLDVKMAVLTLPDELLADENAPLLMARLVGVNG